MSASMTRTVTAYHDRLTQAVAALRGREVSQADIEQSYEEAFPDDPDAIQWIKGADHSSNHTNRGPCVCSMTPTALFERVGHGRCRVL